MHVKKQILKMSHIAKDDMGDVVSWENIVFVTVNGNRWFDSSHPYFVMMSRGSLQKKIVTTEMYI